MKTIIATVAAVLLATAALTAKEYSYNGCTVDSKAVAITIDLKDNVIKVYPDVPASVGRAFKQAATELTADALRSPEGFYTFLAYLTDADLAALPDGGLNIPAVVADTCDTKK